MIVTEVHISQSRCNPIGIITDLRNGTHLLLHHDGDVWEVIAGLVSEFPGFYDVGDTNVMASMPVEIEGTLNRQLAEAKRDLLRGSFYATSSYSAY